MIDRTCPAVTDNGLGCIRPDGHPPKHRDVHGCTFETSGDVPDILAGAANLRPKMYSGALGDAAVERAESLAPHPADQAPAADPALDAVARIEEDLPMFEDDGYTHTVKVFREDLATIRDALADRITPAEARTWAERLGAPKAPYAADVVVSLIARLGRIADRDSEAGR